MLWEIKTYQSFGGISFGVSPDELSAAIGPPRIKLAQGNDRIKETRGTSFPNVFFYKSRAVEIELFARQGDALYEGTDIFSTPIAALKSRLFARGLNIFEGAGTTIFIDLGFSTNLFHTTSTPSVAAFEKGWWDSQLERLKRVK